jgi:hypothetical protein
MLAWGWNVNNLLEMFVGRKGISRSHPDVFEKKILSL